MLFGARHQALDHRCTELQARSAGLRLAVAQDAQVLQAPLALADQVRQGWRWLRAHPQWVGVGVAVLVVWRPRRAWRLGLRLWSAWRLWGRLRQLPALAALLPGRPG